METPQTFYKDALITTPYDLAHRHIRLKKGDKWIKLFGCRDVEYLRKKLIKFSPDKAYISVSCYLDPESVGLKWKNRKEGYIYLPNAILSSDFVMDFDDGKAKSLRNLIKAYKILKNMEFEQFKAIQTNRGFHLWMLDWFAKICRKNLPHKPKYREFFISEKKMELCNELESLGVEFDKQISMDTRRIVKLWGSLSDDIICQAWDDPNQMTKEIIHTSYLPHITKAKRKQLAEVA